MSSTGLILQKVDRLVFSKPKLTLASILLVTLFFAMQIKGVQLVSDFSDLLPQQHPYIQLHNEISDTFGGANNIIVAVEVDEGTIFSNETLALIYKLTLEVDSLTGVNHNLVSSLTHRSIRKVWLNATGGINSDPYYDPTKEKLTEVELLRLKDDVVANPHVYGFLVSPDSRAALIRATLNEGQLDYEKTFNELQQIRTQGVIPGVTIHATGHPVLVGWVYTYVDQILQIFLYTVLIMLVLLIVYFRRLYGIVIPLLGIVLTSIWGTGILSLLGYSFDPLMMVIPFLISARAMSHGIQLVERYYSELEICEDAKQAAQNTFNNLFRPGLLGVISDAIGLLLIAVGSVPINDKLAHYASLWAVTVVFTVLVMVPVLLSVLPAPKEFAVKHNLMRKVMPIIANVAASRKGAIIFLGLTVLSLFVGGYFSSKVQIGEAEPGSSLLYQDHDYNISSKAINTLFPGSEELFIIARADEKGGLKDPEVLQALADFENHMLYDPELGGAKGVPDLVKQVNRILHNNDPRWAQIPYEASYAGGLFFAYMASSPIPGALKEFIDHDEQNANLVFFYKDHKGETIRRAIHQAKAWLETAGKDLKVKGVSLLLAGGSIGVTAAINEAAFETNLIVIPLVLLLIFAFVTCFYFSLHAGWLMLLAMSFATTLTYAYMGITGIGININTVPIIAVGIGVGIDYSIYIMDRIREEFARLNDLTKAIRQAISTTGVAIGFTVTTLIGGVVMWVFISDLRFQADAALLLCVMLILNAIAAMFLVPAWIRVFKPNFITQSSDEMTDRDDANINGEQENAAANSRAAA